MNIDIINKEVSNSLDIKERKVKLVNDFYWGKIYDHIASYNEDPINIFGICTIHPDKYLVRRCINKSIIILRKLLKSNKYKPDSELRAKYVSDLQNSIRKYLSLRKKCKFTN